MSESHLATLTTFTGYLPGGTYHQSGGDHLNFTALNSDGTIIATGAYTAHLPSTDENNQARGYVRVWKYENSAWSQMGQVLWGPGAESRFGSAIDLSDDGLTMIVGAPWFEKETYGGGRQRGRGRAQVYKFEGGSWVPKGSSFSGTNVSGESYSVDRLGHDVSISSDGATVAFGALQLVDGGPDPDTGAGYVAVYNWNGTTWVQVGSTMAGASVGDAFGYKVKLSADASIVAATAQLANGSKGNVRVHTLDNSSQWQQSGLIEPGTTSGPWFGYSLSLSSDGNTMAIGHPYGTQSVSIYTHSSDTWTLVTSIDESPADTAVADGRFGFDVSLNGNGDGLGVVSYGYNAYVRYYESDAGGVWGVVGDRHDDMEGVGGSDNELFRTINISRDGSTIAVGAQDWYDSSLVPPNTGYGRVTVFDSFVFTNVATHWSSAGSSDSGGSSGGVIGDPIVVPVSGQIYALPCDNHVYRYLNDHDGEVTINVRHELSTNVTVREIDAYCNRHPQAREYASVLKASENVPPYAFPRYVYIRVGCSHVTFDLRTLVPIKSRTEHMSIHTAISRRDMVRELKVDPAFKVATRTRCANGIGCKRSGFDVYDNEVGSRVDVSIGTEAYGTLTVHLFCFQNEQLRSGISISTTKPVTTDNSSGAIVAPMLAKDCRLKKLHSERDIVNTGRKPKPCRMTFITAAGNKTVVAM